MLPERGKSNPDKPKLAHNFLVKADSHKAPFTQSEADFSDKQAKSIGAQIRALLLGFWLGSSTRIFAVAADLNYELRDSHSKGAPELSA